MSSSLAPGFLIASPPLGDPNFDRTVVLLAVHNEDGALGFVVNRGMGITVGELMGHVDYEGASEDLSPVWRGGPCQPEIGWLLVDDPTLEGEGIIEVGERLRVSSSRALFDRFAEDLANKNPAAPRRMAVLGYSGWAPKQLETEIATGAWLPTPLDLGILFDVAVDDRWERAFGLLGLTSLQMLSMRNIGQA